MAYETIQVTPTTPNIGAEIAGIDLSRPLGNRQVDEPHDALAAHQVLFFRDQKQSGLSGCRTASRGTLRDRPFNRISPAPSR